MGLGSYYGVSLGPAGRVSYLGTADIGKLIRENLGAGPPSATQFHNFLHLIVTSGCVIQLAALLAHCPSSPSISKM